MTVRIGINGFGRIGRSYLRAALANEADVQVVAVNDLTDAATLATLLEWDSISGHLPGVSVDGDTIHVGDDTLKVLSQRDPAQIPWGDLGADVVIESTLLHRRCEGPRPPDRWREEGDRLRAHQG